MVARWKPSGANRSPSTFQVAKLPSQQFGASLEWIRLNNNDQLIPPIMNVCMDFLSKPDNLETEGIFRKCGNASQIKELMAKINNGERVSCYLRNRLIFKIFFSFAPAAYMNLKNLDINPTKDITVKTRQRRPRQNFRSPCIWTSFAPILNFGANLR